MIVHIVDNLLAFKTTEEKKQFVACRTTNNGLESATGPVPPYFHSDDVSICRSVTSSMEKKSSNGSGNEA